MKATISIIIGGSVLLFIAISISQAVPDPFRYGGIYFDKYPRWMDIIFVVGATFISAFSALVVGAATYSVLECKQIGVWIKARLQRYKNRNRYRFYNVTDKFNPTIKY